MEVTQNDIEIPGFSRNLASEGAQVLADHAQLSLSSCGEDGDHEEDNGIQEMYKAHAPMMAVQAIRQNSPPRHHFPTRSYEAQCTIQCNESEAHFSCEGQCTVQCNESESTRIIAIEIEAATDAMSAARATVPGLSPARSKMAAGFPWAVTGDMTILRQNNNPTTIREEKTV